MAEPAIKVENVSKRYVLGKKISGSLREHLIGLFDKNTLNAREFWALKDISFEVQKGEAVGIIGSNGAGKSTLLKILSRITHPTKGQLEIDGRVASLLEVGTGFHPELTGRENIYLNGTILGMSRKEVRSKFDEIVEFSGVERFIDTAVKHYSSGMYVRLAFSVAAHLEPEILVIDEVLAVGDAAFQKKCLGKMDDVAHSGKTVLFVSHNMAAIRSLCQKGIYLKGGRIEQLGDIHDAIHAYEHQSSGGKQDYDLSGQGRTRGAQIIGLASARFNMVNYQPNSAFEIEIGLEHLNRSVPVKNIQLAVFIADGMQSIVYHLSTMFNEKEIPFDEKARYAFHLDKLQLNAGTYQVWIWLQGNGFEQDYVDQGLSFEVLEGNIYAASSPKIIGTVQKEFSFEVR